ncbi:hypothetical protein CsatB_014973 [Cannabis sativa]
MYEPCIFHNHIIITSHFNYLFNFQKSSFLILSSHQGSYFILVKLLTVLLSVFFLPVDTTYSPFTTMTAV